MINNTGLYFIKVRLTTNFMIIQINASTRLFIDHFILTSYEPSKWSPNNLALLIPPHSLTLQKLPLLIKCDTLSILGPLALESAQCTTCSDNTMAWYLWRERISTQRVTNCSRGRL